MDGKRFTFLAVLGLAGLLALSGHARATFTISTSVSNVLVDGGSVATTTVAPGSTITLVGGTQVTSTNGGVSFSDGVSTIYLFNDAQTVNTIGVTNVGVYESTPVGVADTHSFIFTTNIAVNSTPAFTETLSSAFQNAIGSGQFTILSPASASIGPATALGVASSSPQVTGGNANSSQHPTVSAAFIAVAVPEPASMVLISTGLIGLVGFGLLSRGG